MAERRKKPEPLQPGDEQVAREEIEAHYTDQLAQAAKEFEEAQRRFDAMSVKVDASLTSFRAGERLPDLDVWSIELHAGGVDRFHDAYFKGQDVDREAYEQAKGRRAATSRWLRHQGYPELDRGRG